MLNFQAFQLGSIYPDEYLDFSLPASPQALVPTIARPASPSNPLTIYSPANTPITQHTGCNYLRFRPTSMK
eukprot:8187007-Pyramimonas_sp.AAC.2